jgi:hypothetical protein
LSLIKASYFRTILKVAREADEHVALRLLNSLVNDAPTPGLSGELRDAETAAIGAARRLADCLRSREGIAVAAWNNVNRAVRCWISALPDQS